MAAKKKNALLIPLVAILGGFALGSLIIIGTGRSPSAMFLSMLQAATGIIPTGGFNPRYIGEFIIQAMPIMLTGLSVGFAFRTGLFNIGAEGQLMMGSVAATAVALWVPAPPILHVILVLLAAAAAGGIWGSIPGWFKARFNIHEVVVTIMMNYMALFLNNWMIVYVFGSKDRIKTAMFPASALLKDEFLTHLTNYSRLNWGFIPVILAVILFWFIIDKTTFGFSLRAVGFNKEGARYAGMRVERNIVLSMVIAGAFAGLAERRDGAPSFAPLLLCDHVTGEITAGAILAALGPNLGYLYTSTILMGLANGLLFPILVGLSIQYVDGSRRATAMGIHQSVYAIGMFTGPWAAGLIADALGIRPMFAIMAAISFVGPGALILLYSPPRVPSRT